MPLFFLSGPLYPLRSLPAWLTVLTRIDPITYVVYRTLWFTGRGTRSSVT